MKKDIFNEKIKPEFISYMMLSLVVLTVIFCIGGCLFVYAAIKLPLKSDVRLFLVSFGAFVALFGVFYLVGSLLVIHNYPKYKKLRRLLFNSDCYFVGSDSKEYRGNRRGKSAFNMVTRIAEQNKGLENIRYPRQYKVFSALAIIGIVLAYATLGVAYIAYKNIEVLPQSLQNENVIYGITIITEILTFTFSFICAFRVRKIRKMTIMEYRINNKTPRR